VSETNASILKPEWWSPETDDDHVATQRFQIRALSAIDLLELMTLGEMAGGAFKTSHAGKVFLIRRGLKDWDGVRDLDDGKELPFVLDRAFEDLSAETLFDLASAIFAKATAADEYKQSLTRAKKPDDPPAAA